MHYLIKLRDLFEIVRGTSRYDWQKWLIVGGVLFLSAALAYLRNGTLQILTLVAVTGLAGLLALLMWPSLGLLAILAGAFFVSFSGPGGVNAAVLLVALMSLLWIVDMVVRQQRIHFVDHQTSLPIFIFMLSAVASFFVGQMQWSSFDSHAPITAQIGGLFIYILSGMAFLLVANQVHNLRWLQVFTVFFLFIAALIIFARLNSGFSNFMSRISQPGAHAGGVFWIWMLVIPFSQALINKKLPILARVALMVFSGLVLYVGVILSYDWKSGYVPPLAGVAFIIALLLRRRIIWFIPIVVVIAIYIGATSISSEDYSWLTRMEAWVIVLRLAAVSPIFGLGFGNYYFNTVNIAINGWYVNFNSHSQYVDMLAQTGLVGLLVFGWVFWEIGRLGWRLRDRAPEGFARAYVYGALGGLVGMLVAGSLVDWILPFVYNIGMDGFRSSVIGWMFLGGLVTINQIVERQQVS